MGAKIFGGSFIENRNKNVRTERLKKLSNQLFDVSQSDTQKEAATKLWQALQRYPSDTLATFDHLYAAMALLNLDLVNDIEAREAYLNIISKNRNLRADFLSEFSQKLSSKVEGLKEFEIELQDSVSAASIQAGEATSQEQVEQLINKGKEIRKALIESETFAPDLYKKLLMQGDELKEFSTEELIKLAKMNHGAAMAMFDIGEKLDKDNPLGKKVASEIKAEDIIALLTKESMDDVLKNAYFPVVFCFLLKNCTEQFVEFVKNENNLQYWKEAFISTLNVLFNVTKAEGYRPDILEKLKRHPDLLILLAKAADDRSNLVSEPNAAYLASLIIHANKPSDYFRSILKHDQTNNELAFIIAKQPKDFVNKLIEELQSKRNNNAISESTEKEQFENLLSQVIALVVKHNNQNPKETISTLVNLILTSDEPVKLFNAVVKKDEKGKFSSFVFKNSISFLSQLKRQLISNANHDKQQKQKNLLILQEILQLKLQGWDSVAKALNGNINVSVQDFATSEDVNQLNSPESYNDAIAGCHNRLQEIAGILSDEILGQKIKLPEQRAIDFGAAVTKYINAIKPNDQNDQMQHRDKLLFIARTPVLLDKANLNDMEHLSGEDDYLAKTSAYFKAFNQISNNKENFCEYFYQTYAKPYNQQLLNAENQVQQQGLFETAELIKSSPELLAQFKSEQTFWNKIKAFFGFQTHNKLSLGVIKKVLKEGKIKARQQLSEINISSEQLDASENQLHSLKSFISKSVKLEEIIPRAEKLIENLRNLKKDYDSIMDVQSTDPVSRQTQYLSIGQRYLKIQQETAVLENELKQKTQGICKELAKSGQANSLSTLTNETNKLLKHAEYLKNDTLGKNLAILQERIEKVRLVLQVPTEQMSWKELREHHEKLFEAIDTIPEITQEKENIEAEIIKLFKSERDKLVEEAKPRLKELDEIQTQVNNLKNDEANKLREDLEELKSNISLENKVIDSIDSDRIKDFCLALDLCRNTLDYFDEHIKPLNEQQLLLQQKIQTQINKTRLQSILDPEVFGQVILELNELKPSAKNFDQLETQINSLISSIEEISKNFRTKKTEIESLSVLLNERCEQETKQANQQIEQVKNQTEQLKQKIQSESIRKEIIEFKMKFKADLDKLIKNACLDNRLALLKEDKEVSEKLNSSLQEVAKFQEKLNQTISADNLQSLIELQQSLQTGLKQQFEQLEKLVNSLVDETDIKLRAECKKLKGDTTVLKETLDEWKNILDRQKQWIGVVSTPTTNLQAENSFNQGMFFIKELEAGLDMDHDNMQFEQLSEHLQFCRFILDRKNVVDENIAKLKEIAKKYSPSKNQLFADIPESPISPIKGDLFASVDSSIESSPLSPSKLFASVDSSSGNLNASNHAEGLFDDVESSQDEPSTPKPVPSALNNGRQQRNTPGTPSARLFFITPANNSPSTQQVEPSDNNLPVFNTP